MLQMLRTVWQLFELTSNYLSKTVAISNKLQDLQTKWNPTKTIEYGLEVELQAN